MKTLLNYTVAILILNLLSACAPLAQGLQSLGGSMQRTPTPPPAYAYQPPAPPQPITCQTRAFGSGYQSVCY